VADAIAGDSHGMTDLRGHRWSRAREEVAAVARTDVS
jgi:hypothetical protein